MPFRRRRRKATIGRSGTKHAGTRLANIGPASTPDKTIIIESESGARGEAVFALQDQAFSDETCRAGDLVKFVNLHIQAAPRSPESINNIGWVEYAVCWKREGESDLTNTQLGTLTLGTVATNRYRNDCLWTGFIPLGQLQANGARIQLKMPKSKQFLKVGEELVVFTYFRSQNSAAGGTDAARAIVSYNYKAYS